MDVELVQSNDPPQEDAATPQNNSIATIPIDIEKDLIKDIAVATDIIEKIVSNKNYFHHLHVDENNLILKKSLLPTSSPSSIPLNKVNKKQFIIEESLVKDIADAVAIIEKITSKEIYTNSQVLKNSMTPNRSPIAKEVSKIISDAIINPNLIALEKSIRMLLSKKSIFTNFKA